MVAVLKGDIMLEIKVNSIKPAVRTRAQRREAIRAVRKVLISIRSAEIQYIVNAPCNFSSSHNYIVGENAVDYINKALVFLEAAYDKELPSKATRNTFSFEEPF